MNEASQRIAEHRLDYDAATEAGYFAPSFAQCDLDLRIAWGELETAIEGRDPKAITDASVVWWECRKALREAAIKAGA